MISLGLDTSGAACAVAIWKNKKPLSVSKKDLFQGYSEVLLPMIQSDLSELNLTFQDIEVIGVATGPGSFTGLRTGLAAARGLSLALGCGLIGVSTFDLVAMDIAKKRSADLDKRTLWIIINARRSDFFVQKYQVKDGIPECDGSPFSADADYLGEVITASSVVGGDGGTEMRKLKKLPPSSLVIDDARDSVAKILAEIAASSEKNIRQEVRPLYVSQPQAKLPRNGGQLRS